MLIHIVVGAIILSIIGIKKKLGIEVVVLI